MIAKWYRGYQVFGHRDHHINNISSLVRQNDLGSIIPCLHIEKRSQREFYLFLGFNTDQKGEVPPHISGILDSITIGHPVGDFEYSEIKPMISAGIDTENYRRTIAYRLPVFTPSTNPLDLSDLEPQTEQLPTPEKLAALNRLLYWLSAAGAGSWLTFKNVCDLLTMATTGLDARHIFRRLRLLGHVEYVTANGSKWAICPPTLVQSSRTGCYFLTGQRTPKLLAYLAEYAEVEEQPQPTGEAPELVQPRFSSAEAARQAIGNGQIDLSWAGLASLRLAQILPDLTGHLVSLTPVSGFALSNFTLEQWQGRAYVETHFQQQAGLYRLTPREDNSRLYPQTLYYDAEAYQWRSGPWYDLRYLAQQAAGEPCPVRYHPIQQRLSIPASYRWPDLYERALVLASGLLPLRSPDNNWFYFSDISPELAQTLADKLSATIEEII